MTARQAALMRVVRSLGGEDERVLRIVCEGTEPSAVSLDDVGSTVDLDAGVGAAATTGDQSAYQRPFVAGPDGRTFKLRVRVPEQRLRDDQVLGLATIARLHGCGAVDVTSRGNLQIRGLRAQDCIESAVLLAQLGLSEDGAGRARQYTLTVPPLGGIDREELCDATALAGELRERLAAMQDELAPAVKFHVGFDNGGAVSVGVAANDVTVVPVPVGNGEVMFRLLLPPGAGAIALRDAGVVLGHEEVVPVLVGIIRVAGAGGVAKRD